MRRSECYYIDDAEATQSDHSSEESDNSYQSSTRSTTTRVSVSIDEGAVHTPGTRLYKRLRGKACESRNAIMARMNRERKKEYLTKLEDDHRVLKERHQGTIKTLASQTKLIDKLRLQVVYLESLVANSTEIGKLVRAVNLSTGLPTINSLKSG